MFEEFKNKHNAKKRYHKRNIRGWKLRKVNQKKKYESEHRTIIFLVIFPQQWNSLKSVHKAAKKRDNITTYIVVCPNYMKAYDKDKDEKKEKMEFFGQYDENVIWAKQSEDEWFDLATLHPDYIFRQSPHEVTYPEKYAGRWLSNIAKTCYIPYGYSESKQFLDISFHTGYSQYLYAFFAPNDFTYRYAKRRYHWKWYGRNVKLFNLGFPRKDLILKGGIEPGKKNRVFTWLPRWNVDGKNNIPTNFFNYYQKLLDYFSEHRELSLIIRPHPLMFSNFVESGVMTHEQYKSLEGKIRQTPNIELDDNPDYLVTFEKTDVLIADFTSLIIEFFWSGKPIIYCSDMSVFSDRMTKKSVQTSYMAQSWGSLREWIQELALGNDSQLEKRNRILKIYDKGKSGQIGENIIDELIKL